MTREPCKIQESSDSLIVSAVLELASNKDTDFAKLFKALLSGMKIYEGFGLWFSALGFWVISVVFQNLSDIQTLMEDARDDAVMMKS